MTQHREHNAWPMVISVALAFILTILPLPEWARVYRPEWLGLVIIFWCLTTPTRFGVFTAWSIGLLEDVLRGAIFGQYALVLAFVALLTLSVYRRMRLFPLLQQSLIVGGVLFLANALNLWIHSAADNPTGPWSYWWPPLISLLLWPWIYPLLRGLQARYQRI